MYVVCLDEYDRETYQQHLEPTVHVCLLLHDFLSPLVSKATAIPTVVIKSNQPDFIYVAALRLDKMTIT